MTTTPVGAARRPVGAALPLLAVSLGYFMVILDVTAVNLTLPALGRELQAGIGALQWVVDGYTFTFAALLLTAGTVAARLVQGVVAASMVPASLLQASFANRAARARAVGVWGAIAGLAAASGPVIGGGLTSALSWRAVFAVNVPVALIAILLTVRCLPAPTPRPERRLDPAAQVTAVIGLGALTLAQIEAGDRGFAAPLVLGGLAAAAAALVAFVGLERRTAEPMLPLPCSAAPPSPAAISLGY